MFVMIGLQILGTPDDTVVLIQVEPVMLLLHAIILMPSDGLGKKFIEGVYTEVNSIVICEA